MGVPRIKIKHNDDPRIDMEGIRKVQSLLLSILESLETVASENGISYYLAYGTALGAIRHGDLIPWDTDADVLVPLEQYDALCKALADSLPAHLCLYQPDVRGRHEYLFARVGFRGVDHTLVRLDLFPLAPGPDRRWQRRAYIVVMRLLGQAFLMKQMDRKSRLHYGAKKKVAVLISKSLLLLIPRRALFAAYRRLERLWLERPSETLVSTCGSYGLREFFPKDWFRSERRVKFADGSYPVPEGIELMLQHVYGDYMTPVQEDEQLRALQFATRYMVEPLKDSGVLR